MIKPGKNAHFLSDLLKKVDEMKPENEVSAQVNSFFCLKNKIAEFTQSISAVRASLSGCAKRSFTAFGKTNVGKILNVKLSKSLGEINPETNFESQCPRALASSKNSLVERDFANVLAKNGYARTSLASSACAAQAYRCGKASTSVGDIAHAAQSKNVGKSEFTKPNRGVSDSWGRTITNGNDDSRLNCGWCRFECGAAFTLAEVLITLGVIGIVAAMTLPVITTSVVQRIHSYREANTAQKITQATDKMKALGLMYAGFPSTDAFVDELQKHLRIAMRCDADHIANCWPTEKVITSSGEEFEVSKAKTGKHLGIKGNTSNNVGLVLADGASLILTYNQDSKGLDVSDPLTATTKSLPVGFGKFKEFPYTSSSTGAIDFVMDVNGKHGPNSETRNNTYHDIRSFKAARFSKGCAGISIDGVGCVVDLGTSYECLAKGTDDFDKWDPEGYYSPSCWGGAKKACDDIGMELIDPGTFQNFYKNKDKYPEFYKSLLSSGSSIIFTSAEEGRPYALVGSWDFGFINWAGRKDGSSVALCVGEE